MPNTTKTNETKSNSGTDWGKSHVILGGFRKRNKQNGESFLAGTLFVRGAVGEKDFPIDLTVYSNKSDKKTDKSFDYILYANKDNWDQVLERVQSATGKPLENKKPYVAPTTPAKEVEL